VVPNIRDERRRNTRDDLRSVIFHDVLLGTEAMMFLFVLRLSPPMRWQRRGGEGNQEQEKRCRAGEIPTSEVGDYIDRAARNLSACWLVRCLVSIMFPLPSLNGFPSVLYVLDVP